MNEASDQGYPRSARPYSAAQTIRRLHDLQDIATRCARVVARGYDAYAARNEDGELLRAASERYVISIGTIVEKLHSDYKDRFPDVPWLAITGMRSLVAHHYDHVDHEVVWQALQRRVPDLIEALGLSLDAGRGVVLPEGLEDDELAATPEPFPEAQE